MTDNTARLSQTCMALYAVFAASVLMVFNIYVLVAGTIALLGALIVAYIKRKQAEGGIYESHLHWLVRTFWIGGAVYMPIATVLAVIAIFCVVDFSAVDAAIRTAALEHAPGESDTAVIMNTSMSTIKQQSGGTITLITLLFTLPVFGWWLWRCWKGYTLLKAGKPVEDVMRWI